MQGQKLATRDFQVRQVTAILQFTIQEVITRNDKNIYLPPYVEKRRFPILGKSATRVLPQNAEFLLRIDMTNQQRRNLPPYPFQRSRSEEVLFEFDVNRASHLIPISASFDLEVQFSSTMNSHIVEERHYSFPLQVDDTENLSVEPLELQLRQHPTWTLVKQSIEIADDRDQTITVYHILSLGGIDIIPFSLVPHPMVESSNEDMDDSYMVESSNEDMDDSYNDDGVHGLCKEFDCDDPEISENWWWWCDWHCK